MDIDKTTSTDKGYQYEWMMLPRSSNIDPTSAQAIAFTLILMMMLTYLKLYLTIHASLNNIFKIHKIGCLKKHEK